MSLPTFDPTTVCNVCGASGFKNGRAYGGHMSQHKQRGQFSTSPTPEPPQPPQASLSETPPPQVKQLPSMPKPELAIESALPPTSAPAPPPQQQPQLPPDGLDMPDSQVRILQSSGIAASIIENAKAQYRARALQIKQQQEADAERRRAEQAQFSASLDAASKPQGGVVPPSVYPSQPQAQQQAAPQQVYISPPGVPPPPPENAGIESIAMRGMDIFQKFLDDRKIDKLAALEAARGPSLTDTIGRNVIERFASQFSTESGKATGKYIAKAQADRMNAPDVDDYAGGAVRDAFMQQIQTERQQSAQLLDEARKTAAHLKELQTAIQAGKANAPSHVEEPIVRHE